MAVADEDALEVVHVQLNGGRGDVVTVDDRGQQTLVPETAGRLPGRLSLGCDQFHGASTIAARPRVLPPPSRGRAGAGAARVGPIRGRGEPRRYLPAPASATGRSGSGARLRCRLSGTSLRRTVATSAATRIAAPIRKTWWRASARPRRMAWMTWSKRGWNCGGSVARMWATLAGSSAARGLLAEPEGSVNCGGSWSAAIRALMSPV